jgi:prevent-host-death family protein
MHTIGSRELKATLGKVLRNVRDNKEIYVVMQRGRPVARLVPEMRPLGITNDFDTIWSEMAVLAAEISRDWPEGVSAAQAVSEDRREL